jgi:hypothetical protein
MGNPSGYRYARYYNQREREALTLIWQLRHYPVSLELVRGIDVCTDELGVPAWVLAPLIRAVRQAGFETSQTLMAHAGLAVPPLRTTVHAGEDFAHLLTGLRLVDDAIVYFGLGEGDRIGHALALGVDANRWADRAGRIPIMRETRLFDLAWELSWYRRSRTAVPKRRRSLLENEIGRLIQAIFNVRCDHQDIASLVADLHDGVALWRMGFPNGPAPPSARLGESNADNGSARDALLLAYLTDPAVFRSGRQIEWVDPELEAEGDILAEIQAGIRASLSQREITVEVNPSSNLLIGDLGELSQHPLWRLHPPRDALEAPSLMLCIGSDDPLTFGTNLPQEYQLVNDALVLSGLSSEEARRWLDRVRQRGMEARFTLPHRHSTDITSRWNPSLSEPSLLLTAH